jgi:hypothetical protein
VAENVMETETDAIAGTDETISESEEQSEEETKA